MSRLPLLMLISALLLAGCSPQAGTGGSGGAGGGDPDPTDDFPSSGVPDQNSSTLVAETYNVRGRNFAGTQVNITVFLADQLNNSSTIPNGTEVLFATEAGAIDSSCTTNNGTCSVTWRSQDPIPGFGPVVTDPLGSGELVTSYGGGRAAILMWTLGSESFIDNNSNGLFDDGDIRDPNDPDRGEPFLDKNEDGVRNSGEEFVDFQLGGFNILGGSYDNADNLYAGPNCARTSPADCAAVQSAFIFQNIQLTMSSDFVCLVPVDALVAGPPDYYPSLVSHPATVLTTGSLFTLRWLVDDCYGNPPINGTTIEFEAEVGEIVGPESFTVGNSTADMGLTDTGGVRQRYPDDSLIYSVTLRGVIDNGTAEAGLLTVTATTPEADQSDFDVVDLLDPMN
jgi:hypothetical protein